MKVVELFEVLGPKKSETVEGIEICDPNNGEYNDDEKDGPNSYVGFRLKEKTPRTRAILKAIKDSKKDVGGDMHWIKAENGGLTALFHGKLAPAIAKAKRLIVKFGKEFDAEEKAKADRAEKRAAKGPYLKTDADKRRDAKTKEYGSAITKRVTAKKSNGDDAYSWAIFIDGKEYVGGLTQREIPYYRENAYKKLAAKG